MDTIIKGGKVVSPFGVSALNVYIEAGKIKALSSEDLGVKAKQEIDATGKFVFPGVIDPHLHLGERRPMEVEAAAVTPSAACGGVTTMINYMGSRTKNADVFEAHKKAVELVSVVDMAFHACVFNPDQLEEIPTLAKEYGITEFKFITDSSHKELYPGSGVYGVDDAGLYSAFEKIATLGYPARAMIHAENTFLVGAIEDRVKKEGRNDLLAWSDSRPDICWEEPIWRVGMIAKVVGCPIGIAHSVSPEVIAELRAQGVDIVAEVLPFHLALTKHSPIGVFGKFIPPLRDEEGVEKLWKAVNKGVLAFTGSDHVPIVKQGKIENDIWKSQPNSPGTSMILPIMLSEGVNKSKISMDKVAEVTSYNVAKIFGLYPQKGIIAVGSDADLAIVDMGKEVTVNYAQMMHDKISDYCVYDGMKVKGWPVLTMVRGNIVMENGAPTGKTGFAQYIPRQR